MTAADFKKHNQRFEDRLAAFISSVTESELTPEARAERRARCDNDNLEFMKTYYSGIFNLPWNTMHRWIAALQQGKYSADGFRYCGKSAAAYGVVLIKPLALGVDGVVNLNSFKYDVACQMAAGVVRSIKRNRLLMYDYDIKFDKEQVGYWIINGTPFIAGSFRTGLRSIHDDDFVRITYQLNDDLYGVDEAASEAMCDKIYNFVTDECWGQLDQARPHLSLTLGNAINEQSPIERLKADYPDNHYTLPACIDDLGAPLDPDDGGQSSWPEFRTVEDWRNFKRETPWDVWEGQYMCRPALKGDIMQPEWLRTVNINTCTFITTIAALDPSSGSSPAACKKAFGVGSLTNKQELVMRDIYIRTEPYPQFFDYALMSLIKYNYKVLLFENDFQQYKFAEPYYIQWLERWKKPLPIFQFYASNLATEHRSAAKVDRMLTLVHPYQTGMILWDERLVKWPDYEAFRHQYLSIGKAKDNIDGPDMQTTLYIMIFRYITQGDFRPAKKRLFERVRRVFG